MDKRDIAEILNEIGMLLEIKGENPFKSRAYYEAARNIDMFEGDIGALVKEGKLREIKGLGAALTEKITELVNTGKLLYYEDIKKTVPQGLFDMLRIPGLGPKRVKSLYDSLGIESIGELEYACKENRLVRIPGFGSKTQEKILEGIRNLSNYAGKFHYFMAMGLASELLRSIEESGFAYRMSEGGSLRRRKEIAGDIDILASSDEPGSTMKVFTGHPLVTKVNSMGNTMSSVVLEGGIAADLRVVSDTEYPYALHHFTGSKEHNIAMRHMARQEGIKTNEYGLFRGEELIKCNSEEEIFKVFGMSYIPPELREDNGEIEAAKEGKLPILVKNRDIKGVMHAHTMYSDGLNSIEEMIRASLDRGYSYLGISDHSQSAYYAGGMKLDDIKRQHEEIDRLNNKYSDFRVFKGIELDILPDGSIDYNEDILSEFDFTIASVHSSFRMDEDRMTRRVINAMENKSVTILGHPTGRLLLSREPYRINMEEIIKTASREKVILEINANPQRLDLDWRLCKGAKEAGCKFVISADAHRLSGIDHMEYGINTARKGWLTAEDIINTLKAGELDDIYFKR